MAFTVDYDNTDELITPGVYEALVSDVMTDVTQNGKARIILSLVIRNDVGQMFQNRTIDHAIYKRSNPTKLDMKAGGYPAQTLNGLSKMARVPNKSTFNTLDDWLRLMKGRPLRVTIGHNEFNGMVSTRVTLVEQSSHPECRHAIPKESPESTDDFISFDSSDVDNEELPF
jgi:hypothetical protein